MMTITFMLTVLAWVFFRAESVPHAFSYLSGIFSTSLFVVPAVFPKTIIGLVVVFIFIEWLGRENQYAIEKVNVRFGKPVRYAFYYALIFAMIWFGGKEQEFIYFQF
jgi:hypothetical protein